MFAYLVSLINGSIISIPVIFKGKTKRFCKTKKGKKESNNPAAFA